MPKAPRVVVVSTSGADTELGIEALDLGAVALVEKPTSLATDRLYALGAELVQAVRVAAVARPRRLETPYVPASGRLRPTTVPHVQVQGPYAGHTEVLVVGASTGGPPAVTRLLSTLPADFPVPIAVVVHLPVEYTAAFARRLDATTSFRVQEASDGLPLDPGTVVLARGGIHLGLVRRGDHQVQAILRPVPTGHLHMPAVDVLFASAAAVYGAGALGVVLTGMGDDGTDGARAIRAAGGRTLTESEVSCVVYGMPRAVVDAGLSDGNASLEDMAALIVRSL
jgi:two-component system, chemotaxis family, protein-glutamate methylesterase/glutaminase